MTELRIAVISFAHMHAYSYVQQLMANVGGARLVAAADDDPGRLEKARAQFPAIPAFFGDFRKMLDEVETDAVVITTANADHAPVAVECARRGKHILCEKPLATTVGDARQIIAAARENRVKLMTAFPVRFSPAIAEARRVIRDGSLGRVLGMATSNHGSMPGGWFVQKEKSGGGAVMDHTVHVADLLRWMLADEVSEVYAEYGRRLHDIPTEDCGQLMLRFRGGVFASLDTSWSRPKSYSVWGDVKMEIKCEKGNLTVNCFPRSINLYQDSTMRHTTSCAGDDLDGLMVGEFVSSIREDREPLVTGEDGLRALEVALAAYRAGETGSVVKMDLAAV